MITPEQVRAARALLGLSQEDVAAKIGASTKTIRRAETKENAVSASAIAAIRSALEDSGVEFIEENGGGAGVRWKKEGGDAKAK